MQTSWSALSGLQRRRPCHSPPLFSPRPMAWAGIDRPFGATRDVQTPGGDPCGRPAPHNLRHIKGVPAHTTKSPVNRGNEGGRRVVAESGGPSYTPTPAPTPPVSRSVRQPSPIRTIPSAPELHRILGTTGPMSVRDDANRQPSAGPFLDLPSRALPPIGNWEVPFPHPAPKVVPIQFNGKSNTDCTEVASCNSTSARASGWNSTGLPPIAECSHQA